MSWGLVARPNPVPARAPWTDNSYQDVLGTSLGSIATVNTALVANRLYAIPGYGDVPHALDKMALLVGTFAAASSLRFGVYRHDPATFRPSTLIGESGVVDAGSNGFKSGDVSLTLPAGYWWAAVVSDGTGAMASCFPAIGALGGDGGVSYGYVYMAHTFGALPSTFSTTPSVFASATPRIWVRP